MERRVKSMETIFRSEHPNPQFIRENWINLNGVWQFEVDSGRSGKAKGYMKEEPVLADTICVPFCPESKRSGLEYKDFMRAVWYKRHFSLSEQQIGDNIVESKTAPVAIQSLKESAAVASMILDFNRSP